MKIVHLSDLHFGTEIPEIVESLLVEIKKIQPDLVIISGDFTQRATNHQFKKAKKFIESLEVENIFCVIGNHDISLHNFIERFIFPFKKYKKYISPLLNPYFFTESVAVFGLTSATPYKAQDGIVHSNQLAEMKNFFQEQPENISRIVVLHHNLIRSKRHRIIANAEEIIQQCIGSKVNIILSGHLHYAYLEEIKSVAPEHTIYSITAGTATSFRLCGHPNSFNEIETSSNQFKLSVREYTGDKFVLTQQNTYPF